MNEAENNPKLPEGIGKGYNNNGNSPNNQIIGSNNYVSPSAYNIFIIGNSNSVGTGSQNISIINSSGCIVAGGLSNVSILNSSGITVLTNNTIIINNQISVSPTLNTPSGTYNPAYILYTGTMSGTFTIYPCQYLRVGNICTVSGAVRFQPTSEFVLGITLPIPSNFSQSYQCSGNANSSYITTPENDAGIVYADTVDKTALLHLYPHGGLEDYYFHFTYLIL